MTKKETLELPSIFVAEGYDSIEDEDGNMGFGVYVPRDKQIYVAGEVPYEMFVKALFHELAHWVQDVAGNEFNEDEANDFAERVYEAIQNLPSAQPERRTCEGCKHDNMKWHEGCKTCARIYPDHYEVKKNAR